MILQYSKYDLIDVCYVCDRPLDTLQNCLLNLRSEISSMQAQMDSHQACLQSSNNAWR